MQVVSIIGFNRLKHIKIKKKNKGFDTPCPLKTTLKKVHLLSLTAFKLSIVSSSDF